MATKLHPVGEYVYDSDRGELDSPDGCTLEKDGKIYGDNRTKYPNVVKFNGEINPYFVPTNEIMRDFGTLEKKVSSELNYVIKLDGENIKFENTLPILYLVEMSIGVGIILAEFFSGK